MCLYLCLPVSVVEVLEKHGLQKPISYVKNSQNSVEEAHQLMVKLCRHTGRRYGDKNTHICERYLSKFCGQHDTFTHLPHLEIHQWVRRCGKGYCRTCSTCNRMCTPVSNQKRVTGYGTVWHRWHISCLLHLWIQSLGEIKSKYKYPRCRSLLNHSCVPAAWRTCALQGRSCTAPRYIKYDSRLYFTPSLPFGFTKY